MFVFLCLILFKLPVNFAWKSFIYIWTTSSFHPLFFSCACWLMKWYYLCLQNLTTWQSHKAPQSNCLNTIKSGKQWLFEIVSLWSWKMLSLCLDFPIVLLSINLSRKSPHCITFMKRPACSLNGILSHCGWTVICFIHLNFCIIHWANYCADFPLCKWETELGSSRGRDRGEQPLPSDLWGLKA